MDERQPLHAWAWVAVAAAMLLMTFFTLALFAVANGAGVGRTFEFFVEVLLPIDALFAAPALILFIPYWINRRHAKRPPDPP